MAAISTQVNKAAKCLEDKWNNSSVGQFCKKAVNTVTEFYEKNKAVINMVFGAAVIAVCTVATIATGGAACWTLALAGSIIGGGIGATGGALSSAIDYMEENGTLDGSTSQILEGASSGFAKGSFEGAVTGYGIGKIAGSTKYMKQPNAYCFVAGTLIVTALGFANIEDIRPGDYVYAKNTETGEQNYMPVLETYENEVYTTYTVTIDGEAIETTYGHPFYVVDEGWVDAGTLETGDEVELSDGESGTVDSVERQDHDEPVTIYNFCVMDYHTYYVGEDSVLVHNNNCKEEIADAIGSGDKAVDIELKYKDTWTSAQRAEADAKIKALSEAKTVKTPVNRGGTSASSRYKSAYGKSSVPRGYDVDHIIDLQLGGADDILNMNPLDMSVNRSLGVQIKNAIKQYPDGTVFGNFTIH